MFCCFYDYLFFSFSSCQPAFPSNVAFIAFGLSFPTTLNTRTGGLFLAAGPLLMTASRLLTALNLSKQTSVLLLCSNRRSLLSLTSLAEWGTVQRASNVALSNVWGTGDQAALYLKIRNKCTHLAAISVALLGKLRPLLHSNPVTSSKTNDCIWSLKVGRHQLKSNTMANTNGVSSPGLLLQSKLLTCRFYFKHLGSHLGHVNNLK